MHEKFVYVTHARDPTEASERLLSTPQMLLLWARVALVLFFLGSHLFHLTLEDAH